MDQLICMADNRRVLLKGEGFQIFRHLNDIKDLPADHPVSLFTQSLINTQKKGKKSRTKGHKLFRVSLPEKKTEKKRTSKSRNWNTQTEISPWWVFIRCLRRQRLGLERRKLGHLISFPSLVFFILSQIHLTNNQMQMFLFLFLICSCSFYKTLIQVICFLLDIVKMQKKISLKEINQHIEQTLLKDKVEDPCMSGQSVNRYKWTKW